MEIKLASMAALTALLLAGCSRSAPDEAEQSAIAAIKELGGKFTQDETRPGRPVIVVNLSNTKVTDAGLAPFKNLKQLQTLLLDSTNVRNEGLTHLKELTKLQVLSLVNTSVRDEGLVHLKELKQLQMLNLNNTQVTDAGIRELKKSLPMAMISK